MYDVFSLYEGRCAGHSRRSYAPMGVLDVALLGHSSDEVDFLFHSGYNFETPLQRSFLSHENERNVVSLEGRRGPLCPQKRSDCRGVRRHHEVRAADLARSVIHTRGM
jgi:hypothetical protein